MEKTAILEKVAQKIEETTIYKGVTVMKIEKNNGVKKVGLNFPVGDNTGATLYIPEEVIEALLDGSLGIEEAASGIVRQFNNRGESPIEKLGGGSIIKNYISDKNKLLQCTRCAVVNAFKNQNLRETAPHKVMLDLLIVYRVFIDSASSFLLSNQIMEAAGVTEEEIEKAAFENTRQFFRMATIAETLAKYGGMMAPPSCFTPNDNPLNHMLVVTTDTTAWGASAIADTEYLDKIAKTYGGSDFIIFPSSVNEIITIPKDDVETTDGLVEMVKDINSTEVQPTEFLSDSVYIYNAEKHELEMIA